ncbi:MAG: glucose 1-dehydrogenase [Halobacteria archaeon]|nr:glucose 1-dehydrogenase [Halobacteria archaeon]
MRGLKDKTAIVTGSGRGIGRQIALRLSGEGATVAVNDIDEEKARETVQEIRDKGGEASTAVADVTNLGEVKKMVSEVADKHEGVDILVNNAGWDEIEWFLDQDPEVWDRIIDINLKGQINCSRSVAEVMVERQTEGKIINISSDAGRVGSSGEAVYSGAKGGIISFTKTLARELARYGINCNVVAPGPTDTPLTRRMREDSELGRKIFEGMKKQIPFGRMAEPEDIAGAVVFMASEDADYITGQVLSVSGGLTMVG